VNGRPNADPSFTFGVSLVLSLVLWWPTLRSLLAGRVDITHAGLRYLAALALAWAGVYFVASLVTGYGHQPRPASPPPGTPQRRRDDPAPTPESDDAQPTAA
jgi:hypothetical protein